MLWLAILLPALPLQVFTRGIRDALPLAIVAAPPGTTLLEVTPCAQALGVHPGMRGTSALALVPELRLQPRDTAREHAALAEIATWAGRFSPRISLSPPDAVLVEISACLRLFGGASRIERTLREALQAELGFEARTGCAPTPLAARWFARTGLSFDPARALQTEGDAATSAPPEPLRPVTHVHASPAHWVSMIDPLPLPLLGEDGSCDAHTLALLEGLGLRTLGEVRRLPAAGLARRQAQSAARTLARARGELPDPRPWFEPPARFDHGLALPASTHQAEALLFAARRLFASLAGWLQARHAAVDLCSLVLEHTSRPPTLLELAMGVPSQDEARFALIARERLATIRLDDEVRALRLQAEHAVDARPASSDLFGDPSASDRDAALLLARLQARLGRSAIYRLDAHGDHRPESAWLACEPGAVPRTTGAGRSAPAKTLRTTSKAHERLRPLWLLPVPGAISPERLTLLGDAERIETGWWDGQVVRRDYYLARDVDQSLCWVFNCLDAPGEWFVHGYFG